LLLFALLDEGFVVLRSFYWNRIEIAEQKKSFEIAEAPKLN